MTDEPHTALTGKPMRTPWPPADMPAGHVPVYLRWDDDTDQCVMRNGGASDDPALVYYIPERTYDLWLGALIAWEAAKSQMFWEHIAPRLDQVKAAPCPVCTGTDGDHQIGCQPEEEQQ